jgi:hypothetical protein
LHKMVLAHPVALTRIEQAVPDALGMLSPPKLRSLMREVILRTHRLADQEKGPETVARDLHHRAAAAALHRTVQVSRLATIDTLEDTFLSPAVWEEMNETDQRDLEAIEGNGHLSGKETDNEIH